MDTIKSGLLVLLLCNSISYAVTLNDVQKLDTNKFFGEWSKFLDQVLQSQQEQISAENEAIYQAFVQKAKDLNIPKVTGNEKSISGMKEQMVLVKKRMGGEKQLSQEWTQFADVLLNSQQPLSAENEETYKAFIRRAKDLGVAKAKLDEMEIKMNEIKDKLSQFAVMQPPLNFEPIPMQNIPAPNIEITPAKEAVKPEMLNAPLAPGQLN